MNDQAAFNFDDDHPAAVSVQTDAIVPPKAWCAGAIEACFGSQKKRWTAMTEPERNATLQHMWDYSQARAAAIASPTPVFECEAALLGWVSKDSALAAVISALNARFVPTSEIPAPSAA